MKQERLTRAKAINYHCRECFGWDGFRGGNVGTPFVKAGMDVKECEDKKCSLWSFRMGKEIDATRPIRKPKN